MVIGLDVSLALLSAFLQQQGLPPGSQAAILSESGEIIASLPTGEGGNNGGLKMDNLPVLQSLLAHDDAGTVVFSMLETKTGMAQWLTFTVREMTTDW
jgi:hypothetical protein